MSLSTDLITQLVKITNDTSTESTSSTVNGTAKKIGSSWYVQIDGSEVYTPIESTTSLNDGDRVSVTIASHTATVTGNYTDQSASSSVVTSLSGTIDEMNNTLVAQDNYITALSNVITLTENTITIGDSDIVIQDGTVKIQDVDIDALATTVNTNSADIKVINSTLETYNSYISIEDSEMYINGVSISALNDTVSSQGNEITTINNTVTAQGNTISELNDTIISQGNDISALENTVTAQGNTITEINDTITSQGNDISAISNTVTAQGNTISELNDTIVSQGNTITSIGNTIDIYKSSFQITNGIVTGIVGLDGVTYITTEEIAASLAVTTSLDANYAQIDFANIGEAAVEQLFTLSGIIGNLVMDDGYVTGTLVGVTISGDLIIGNTIQADKLVLLGEDGLYYTLNVTGETVEAKQTEENSLNGSIITAKSITATKISVEDLVAFGATIGGFVIDEDCIRTVAKGTVDATTVGIYLDNSGQFNFGDAASYIKGYYDEDGSYKLEISVESLYMSTGKNIAEALDETVVSTVIYYGQSSSSDVEPTTWSKTCPEWADGYYIWQKIVVVYGNGTVDESISCITGATGATGANGENGEDGTSISITSTTVTYQASTSGTDAPTTGTWSTSVPNVSQGSYLWTKTVVNYSDGTSTTSYSVSYYATDGEKGDKGDTGETGAQGEKGEDGESITITANSITYQASDSGTDTPTGDWTETIPAISQGQYLWTRTIVSYSDDTSTVSYSVSYISIDGENGENGEDAAIASDTEPEDTSKLWLDTSDYPYVLKAYSEYTYTVVETDDDGNEIEAEYTEYAWCAVNDETTAISEAISQVTTEVTESLNNLSDNLDETNTAVDNLLSDVQTVQEQLGSYSEDADESITGLSIYRTLEYIYNTLQTSSSYWDLTFNSMYKTITGAIYTYSVTDEAVEGEDWCLDATGSYYMNMDGEYICDENGDPIPYGDAMIYHLTDETIDIPDEAIIEEIENAYTSDSAKVYYAYILDEETGEETWSSETYFCYVNVAGAIENISALESLTTEMQSVISHIVLGDDNGVPYISLSTTDSDFSLKITNKQISFIEGDNVVAYISENKLWITDAEVNTMTINSELNMFNNFSWIDINGYFVLVKESE